MEQALFRKFGDTVTHFTKLAGWVNLWLCRTGTHHKSEHLRKHGGWRSRM